MSATQPFALLLCIKNAQQPITLLFLSQVTGYIFTALASSILNSSFGLARILVPIAG